MIKGFIIAVQFLTRLPINVEVDYNEENIRRSIFFYPYVGLILGGLAFIPYYFISRSNRDIASFLTLFTMIYLTGGLHLDGLSDTVDGFYSNKNREETLKIMKDSRIGAFGVLSLILTLLFKFILILNLKENLGLALILSMANSRLAVLMQISYKRTARPGGLGDIVHKSSPHIHALMGSLIYIILLGMGNISYLLPLLGAIAMGEAIARKSYRKIDGLTGDVYGAIIELSELVSLFICWRLML